jgi:hypothetical protein
MATSFNAIKAEVMSLLNALPATDSGSGSTELH